MKKIYTLIGLIGFFLIIGVSGGADSTSFGTTVLLMILGLIMLGASPMLLRLHEINAKYRRKHRKYRKTANKKVEIVTRQLSQNKVANVCRKTTVPKFC